MRCVSFWLKLNGLNCLPVICELVFVGGPRISFTSCELIPSRIKLKSTVRAAGAAAAEAGAAAGAAAALPPAAFELAPLAGAAAGAAATAGGGGGLRIFSRFTVPAV